MKLVFATYNKGKLREAREILGPGFEVLSPEDLGIREDVEETGTTFRENSLLKARALYDKTGLACFADDSGLEVDSLGGAPGVYSARYAGEGHDFEANIDKLLREMNGVSDRSARFRCCVTLILPEREPLFFEGSCEGSIALRRRGDGGFGYDPVFLPDGFGGLSMAEIGEDVKNAVSHRASALDQLSAWLNK